VAPHRGGGEAQYVPVIVNEAADPANLAAVQRWTLEHLGGLVSVDDLAARAVMSSRNFARRYRTTPQACRRTFSQTR
jgi:AraC family transcriptional regulator, transcriptional activator FtrA